MWVFADIAAPGPVSRCLFPASCWGACGCFMHGWVSLLSAESIPTYKVV